MTSLKIKSLLSGLLLALAMVFSAPALADALDDARAAGLVGERPDGLVAPVSPSAPANIQSLVQSVNAQRLEKYQQIANQKGVPVEQIGAIAGEKIIGKLKPGFKYMDCIGHLGHEVRTDGWRRSRGTSRRPSPFCAKATTSPIAAWRPPSFYRLKLKRPLFLEGEAGVGKTEIAKVLAATLGRTLVRLQCYEGLDVASAVYEWDYPRQMLEIRLAEAAHIDSKERITADIFSERFLIKRPLLQALESEARGPKVLLIDELDRTDEPFEAFLLELLSDFQVTIPELGVIKAEQPPIVVITSNRTREIHDALKRRCFYYWVDYPSAERELEILRARLPAASLDLSREVVGFVQKLRGHDLFKLPGVAETIDWTDALVQLDQVALTPDSIDHSLGALLKYQDDIARIRGSEAAKILEEVRAEMAAARR